MLIPSQFEEIILLLLVAIIVIPSLKVIILIASDVDDHNLKKKMKAKLSVESVTFNDYKNIITARKITYKRGLKLLELLKADIDLSVDLTNNKEVKERIDELVSEFKRKEPFSDFPEEIRNVLYVFKGNSDKPELVDHLAEKLNLYIKKQNKNELASRFVTYIGTGVGIIGLAFGFLK